jgi:hypothetical protein
MFRPLPSFSTHPLRESVLQPTTQTESTEAALQARVLDLECQTDRWTALAAAAKDTSEQERCCKSAQEAQSEARKLRQELAAVLARKNQPRRWFGRWKLRGIQPR